MNFVSVEDLERAGIDVSQLPVHSEQNIVASMWVNDSVRRPEKSGEYLVKYELLGPNGNWSYTKVNYSKKYDRWNFYDHMDPEEDSTSFEVDFWMEEDI